jgi:NitT/TauT family transport system permease protein
VWDATWPKLSAIAIAIAIGLGAVLGTAVSRVPVLRAAIGSLITGMQAMPSVLWFPLAVMVFGLSSKAVVLMIVLGSAPAIVNGFISGIDQVPPRLTRARRILGARGFALQCHVVVPAALPVVLRSLKQGWAFAWHALMAGEFSFRWQVRSGWVDGPRTPPLRVTLRWSRRW